MKEATVRAFRHKIFAIEILFYRGWVLEKFFRTSRMLLRLFDVNCQRVLFYLKCKSRALRSVGNPKVGCSWSFRQYEEMCNPHRPRNIQKVSNSVSSLLLKINAKNSANPRNKEHINSSV